MKHKMVPLVVVAAFMLMASSASAQGVRVRVDGDATVTPASARTQAEVRAQVESGRASTTEGRVEMQVNVVKRVVANVSRVLSATAARLEGIIERVESRIAKFKAGGAATLESEGFVAEAKVHLEKAEVSISTLSSLELGEVTLRENMVKVRAAASEAKMHIREAHTSLMMAVRSLKATGGVRVEGGANATTTSN